jgi:hypothetical protein
MTPGAIYVDEVGPSVTRYYWVRFVNTNDTPGPYNALVGTSATTGSDVTYTLGLLAGQITTTELATTLNNRINLIDGPATTTGTIPNQLAFLQGQVDAITSYPDYDNATTYATDDIVKYEGGLYKALSSTTGNLPTNATFWLKIGDYSSLADIVAAHTADISTLTTDLGGEVTAREALATQMRGGYTGTDLASVTTGLIFSERTARADADTGLASSISSVSATAAGKNRIFRQATAPSSPQANDIWVDTKISYSELYFEQDFAKVKNKQYQWDGAAWLDITDVDIEDNYALVVREQTARATADDALAQDILTLNAGVNANDVAIRADLQVETTTRANADTALSSQITTLNSQVNNATTGLPATRATLINDYSTTATVNSAIASSKTALRAYTDVSASRTFRQAAAPTKRGVDADTTLDIPLQTGDVWVDIDDQNKLYQWSGTAWVYSPDGAITGSVTALAATLDTEYLTATDTENAIAQSATFLRAYADVQSKVFRQSDAPTKRGVDPETEDDIPLLSGDVWYDTNDSNKLYLWSGSAWVYSPDAVITGSVTAVDSRVTTVENTKIGYCTIGGLASDDTNKAACEAAGGTWNVGIPIATAVKQVSISVGEDSATLEQRFTAQNTLNNGLQAQQFVKIDINGNVVGYGVFADSTGSSEFIANVNRFAVTTPQTSIQVRATSTTYAQGAIARVADQDSKTLVCKIGGSTGTGSITVGNIGTLIVDGSVTWQVASRVPFAVQAVPTEINGQPVPAGVYIDAAYVLNATIQNAQIADLAVDDQKIVNINAAKITAGFISADRIEAGSLDAKIANIDAAIITAGFIDSARIADATITTAKIAGVLQSTDYGKYASIVRKAPGDSAVELADIIAALTSTATGPASPTPGFACIEVIGMPAYSSARLDFEQFGSPFFTGIRYEDGATAGSFVLNAYLGGNKITLTNSPTKTTRARIEWAIVNSNTTSLKAFLGDTQTGPTYFISESAYSQTWAVRPVLTLQFRNYIDATIGFGATADTIASRTYTLQRCEQTFTGWRIDKQGNLDLYNGTINASAIKTGEITAEVIRSKSATEFSKHSLSLQNGVSTAFSFTMAYSGIAAVIAVVNWNLSGTTFSGSVSGSIGGVATTSVSFTNVGLSLGSTSIIGSANLLGGGHQVSVTASSTGSTGPHIGDFILLRSYR